MKRQDGFTLLELLIGLALLVLMLALLFGGFRIASTSWNSVETRIERSTQESIAKAFMRRLLVQLQPLRWKKLSDGSITFRGDSTRILGIAPLTGQAGSNGMRLVALAVEPDPSSNQGELQLVLHEAQVDHESEDFSAPIHDGKSHALLDNLSNVKFTYFGPEKRGAMPAWHETWPSKEELPRLLRIRFVSRSSGPTDLIIAPMISGIGCVWDPFYKRCR
jgi:general secretion pathway protein J